MKKKTLKLITILLTVLICLSFSVTVFAAGSETETSTTNIFPEPSASGTGKITDVGTKILGVIQTVGGIIAVAVIMILGIKYMMGSAEEKAEYKKTFIPYIVGVVLLVASVSIITAIATFANELK